MILRFFHKAFAKSLYLFQSKSVTEFDKKDIFQVIVIVLLEQFAIEQISHIIDIIQIACGIITASCLAPD
jgi:hypothetical protein